MKTLGKFFGEHGRPMPRLFTLLMTALFMATLVAAKAPVQSQTCVIEVQSMDISGMQVEAKACPSDDWKFEADAFVLDSSHLKVNFHWADDRVPCGPVLLAAVYVNVPGHGPVLVAEIYWDGGAILIDLTDF